MGRLLFGAAMAFLQGAALALGAASALAQTPRSISVTPAPAWRGKTLYSNSWAVVIGIDRYQHPRIPELRYARKDAEDIRKTLPKLGFPESRILTLFDRQATKRAIERLLGDQMRRLVSPNDRLFVFFAGHGKDEEGEGYLIPYDADPENLYS
ncbi:MAG: caspase family protein, partial [Candidatus Tectomicrobia bacterium]|nr:caspase family protein [Candidatus Tectomicrobia bacterium]